MRWLFLTGLLFLLAGAALTPSAQEAERVITQDAVNAVAQRMYCPVCENIPLDDCGTSTCIQWKEEIRLLLLEGWSSDQIVNDFVARYGDNVVGIPQDPFLRALSLVAPLLATLFAFALGLWTFRRWNQTAPAPAVTASSLPPERDSYIRRIEEDLG